MSSINLPVLPRTLTSFRRLVDLFKEKIFYRTESKNKPYKNLRVKFYGDITSEYGESFVLEPINEELSVYCMTGFGSGIKVNDFIAIDKTNLTTYQVVNIDYYLDPSDMWIALLQKCDR
jgi:hypothetical protein